MNKGPVKFKFTDLIVFLHSWTFQSLKLLDKILTCLNPYRNMFTLRQHDQTWSRVHSVANSGEETLL
jgi:hypothetical protein